MKYKRFSDRELKEIYELLDRGISQAAIGRWYGRTQQAISYLKQKVRVNGACSISNRF